MSQAEKPYVWQMIREAVTALGGATTNVAIRDWILRKYPGTNTNTIACQIIVCTVNHRSRVHYPENKKARLANGPYDFLFRPQRGLVECYDPNRHGLWRIIKTDDGGLAVTSEDCVGPIDAVIVEKPEDAQALECNGFAQETHLRDYLAQHLDQIEEGLQLYVDDNGDDGVEYVTPIGRIDILARDKAQAFVVIELKVGRGPDAVAGQVLRYKNWIKRHLANGERVRGIIVASHINDRICYAVADDPDITLREYELSMTFRKPDAQISSD